MFKVTSSLGITSRELTVLLPSGHLDDASSRRGTVELFHRGGRLSGYTAFTRNRRKNGVFS